MAKVTGKKSGVVLVMFGTSSEKGLSGFLHIRDRVVEKCTCATVKIAFTSRIIRRIWQQRADNSAYRKDHPDVPEEIFHISSPEAVMKDFLDQGVDMLVLQPVQIAPAIEGEILPFLDTLDDRGREELLASFQTVTVGRPALGALGSLYSYRADIATVARSLAPDFTRARMENAALFYLGHGNKLSETKRVYNELVEEIRSQYPNVQMVMSMVEGSPEIKDLVGELQSQKVDKILLKAFMVAAGNHARKDMAGAGPATLKTMLEKEGFSVIPDLTGLGELSAFADIFVQHAEDAANDAGMKLM